MKVKDCTKYCFFIYKSAILPNSIYKLGDIVINKDNEIGVIIQIHEDTEFRTDMFGNCSASEIKLATNEDIEKYRPDLFELDALEWHYFKMYISYDNKKNTKNIIKTFSTKKQILEYAKSFFENKKMTCLIEIEKPSEEQINQIIIL